jgi:hypothetical protein
MWAHVEDGAVVKTIPAPQSIRIGGINYPANIFDLWTPAGLAELGIYPLVAGGPAPEYPHDVESETISFDADNSRAVVARTYRRLPDPVPRQVSKLQLIRALREAGTKGNFKSVLAKADEDTQEDWELAYAIERSSSLIAAFAADLSLTGEQTDAIFRRAAEL